MNRAWALLISAILLATIFPTAPRAETEFPNYPEPDLPVMGQCQLNVPQPLPVRWQATALMSPYLYSGKGSDLDNLASRAELQVGRFIYDGDKRLMRATRHGVTSARVIDLLVSDENTFVLKGDYKHPTCVATLKNPYKVPPRIWQDAQAQATCVGNHAIAPTIENGPTVDWWKQKSPITAPGASGQAADWYWTDTKGYPVRTMFWGKHDGLPAILGDYAFTNFSNFAEGNDVDLGEIAATCKQATGLPAWTDDELAALPSQPGQQDEHAVGDLVPGLSYKACERLHAEPPSWPASIYMSSFSTAAKYGTPKPLATSVYFDPAAPKLRTRLHKSDPSGGPQFSDALLIDTNSYGVDLSGASPYNLEDCASGAHTSLPGSPHAQWGKAGHCQCMGVIENNSVLSPGRNTEIISCPLPLEANESNHQTGNTLFWMWYTMADPMKPVVFMQTEPDVTIGTGLSLADYTLWRQKAASEKIFTTPAASACPAPPPSAPTPPAACQGCHNWSTNQ